MSSSGSLATQLRDAVCKCDLCVFVATGGSIKSSWRLAEVGAFWGVGKRGFLVHRESPTLGDEKLPPQFKGNLFVRNVDSLICDLRATRDRISCFREGYG